MRNTGLRVRYLREISRISSYGERWGETQGRENQGKIQDGVRLGVLASLVDAEQTRFQWRESSDRQINGGSGGGGELACAPMFMS